MNVKKLVFIFLLISRNNNTNFDHNLSRKWSYDRLHRIKQKYDRLHNDSEE